MKFPFNETVEISDKSRRGQQTSFLGAARFFDVFSQKLFKFMISTRIAIFSVAKLKAECRFLPK